MRLLRSPGAFQISYLRSEGREVVARITIATEGLELGEGSSIDLGGEYAPGHPRCTVSRAIDGEPLRVLPRVASGTLELDDVPEVGAEISGNFSLRFGEGGDVGAGRAPGGP